VSLTVIHTQDGVLFGHDMLGSAAGSHEVKVTEGAMEGATLPPGATLAQHGGFEVINGVEAKRMCAP